MEIKKYLIIAIFAYSSFLTAQEYCSGDIISEDHQNTVFNQCYPEGCDCEDESLQVPWSLADNNSKAHASEINISYTSVIQKPSIKVGGFLSTPI